jgi:hypothetical protein
MDLTKLEVKLDLAQLLLAKLLLLVHTLILLQCAPTDVLRDCCRQYQLISQA